MMQLPAFIRSFFQIAYLLIMLFGCALSLKAEPITVIAQPLTPEVTLSSYNVESKEETKDVFNEANPQEPENAKEEQPSVKEALKDLTKETVTTVTPYLPAISASSQLEKLKETLETYQEKIKEHSHWPQWTCLKHSFRLSDEDPILLTVKQQLELHGDLSAEEETKSSPKFDKEVETAVKRFQSKHLLEPDGVIGRKTCLALNLSYQERLKRIKANITRWEQLVPNLKGRSVLINIPTYQLYGLEDDKVVLSQPVIVGLKSRATPIFTTSMTSIVLNPPWGVPTTIFVKDKLRKVVADPEYLERNGYIVMDKEGQLLTSSSIDWSHVSMHYFPYRVRQLPGKHNALGAIKFILDNDKAIYMHGTPQVHLFQKIERAFSSGCVRLASPLELATWVLTGTKFGKAEKLEAQMQTQNTLTLSPSKPIPVHFGYITVWVDEKDQVLFSDPYDLDERLPS